MKICPRCQKTYTDDGLNFCLDDGSTLVQSNAAAQDQPAATVLMNQTRPTEQQSNQTGWNPNSFQNQNQFSMQPPPKKSKGWIWALGILGVLALVCGGGFIGLVFLAGNIDDTNKNSSGNYPTNFGNRTTSTPTHSSNVQKIDVSRWVQNDQSDGTTEYSNGELLMGSKQKNYYYVLLAQNIYKTENATTKVSVRNIDEENTKLGFGLIVHSSPTPLIKDYGFLIDSENKKFRIVRHSPGTEIVVLGWTNSNVIKDGTEKNVLEVRDENKKMNFYINGSLVKTVPNEEGYPSGVAGLYSGDGIKIGFSDMEIAK